MSKKKKKKNGLPLTKNLGPEKKKKKIAQKLFLSLFVYYSACPKNATKVRGENGGHVNAKNRSSYISYIMNKKLLLATRFLPFPITSPPVRSAWSSKQVQDSTQERRKSLPSNTVHTANVSPRTAQDTLLRSASYIRRSSIRASSRAKINK